MSLIWCVLGLVFFIAFLMGLCTIMAVLGAGACRDEEKDRAEEEKALAYYREHGEWQNG